MEYTIIEELFGKTLIKIDKRSDEIRFLTTDNETYRMYHNQDCCESVSIEDIDGDLNDLIGYPLLLAEETTSRDPSFASPLVTYHESFTWTYYRFATTKGYVNIRWLGESNGYYSESVMIEEIS